ncbi:MAG TPA: response regulator transcription factor [Clostridia bacterium]|jgi:DNA-binding response OmpR family regulator|nr:MAG: Transcriptional regulatory protein YycF [Firmicutes bacterium ADurb.Bin146]HOD92890.1 response regulator transcription factor [Clostridia bacterium]HQM39140.1 response regulator transcription factor [Clostridia bacterium]
MTKILIADDNKQITSILEEYSKKEGYDVSIAYDGIQAIEKIKKETYDIILMDVMMPKMDGFEVVREIRKDSDVPVIMITARGEDFEKIMGLDIGADDYIVKPFSPQEVMARIRAVLRRLSKDAISQKKSLLKIDNLIIDIDEYIVTIDKNKVMLTKKELELLWTLASASGKVFTRDNLLNMLWGYDYYGDTRTVDTHIKRLRAKLNEYPHENWEVKTIWAIGYKFEETKNEE